MRLASLWLTLCISYGALAAPFGINPSKIKQKPFYLYKDSTVDLKNNTEGVDGFSYKKEDRTIYIQPTGSKSTLSLEDFLFYRRLGASSFQTITGTGTGAGSSFLVGENLVLTNKHVAATDNKKKACGKFAIEFGPEKILCKKVWYCD